MAWTTPRYTHDEVNQAGTILISSRAATADREWALKVINNWRAVHSFPLNTFSVTLRKKARGLDSNGIVAQRLKRLYSIELKLTRMRRLTLSEMQDIGGCRAILGNVRLVRQLRDLYLQGEIRHGLEHQDDYIAAPKKSGYRGVHLIYRYKSDRKHTYNGRKIEMQFRTHPQHIWATAVETAGTFTNQALKVSRGDRNWLRFFALMGTETALREKAPPVPDTPSDRRELKRELRELAHALDVEGRLTTFSAAAYTLPKRASDRYFLVVLDSVAKQVKIKGYSQRDLFAASSDYLDAEREVTGDENRDAVLVSVDSVAALKRAYPNYFLDTHKFLEQVRRAIA